MNATQFWLILYQSAIVLFHILSVWNVLNLADDVSQRLTIPLPIELVMSLIWAGLFAWGIIALIRHKSYAIRYTGWMTVGWLMYCWLRVAIFARADYDQQRLVLSTGLTLLIVLPLVVMLIQRPKRSPQNKGE